MNPYLAVPTRGSIRWEVVTRLEAIRDEHPGLRPISYQPGHISVAITRNLIVSEFLKTDCDTLIMIDDDVVPPPHLLESLLPMAEGYGMIGIPYPMVNMQYVSFCIFEEVEEGFRPLWPSTVQGLHDCAAIGTGCVAIAREAIEAVNELGPNSAPFFTEHDPSLGVVGEDFIFCRDLRTLGFKIGYVWDEFYADHVTTIGIAPMMEKLVELAQQMAEDRKEHVG